MVSPALKPDYVAIAFCVASFLLGMVANAIAVARVRELSRKCVNLQRDNEFLAEIIIKYVFLGG